MPYASNDELPEAVRDAYSERCQTQFRKAFNAAMEQYDDEAKAFATAHAQAKRCMGMGDATKAEWDAAYINDLPDSAFAVILPGGEKDEDGRTVPRSLRKLPHHNAAGVLDMPHLRNAMSREPQADMPESAHAKASAHLTGHARSEGMMKAEQITSTKWRVLAIPFGGPFAGGKDLDGEFFDHDTDIKARWFKERPVLFHHGQDELLGSDEIGVEDDLEEHKDGWWGTVWLDRSHRYWAQVDALIRAGKMYGSSGAIAHLVRKSRSGHIDTWPHAEQTFTPTPANPFARVTASKALGVLDLEALADDLRPDLLDPGDALAADLGTDGDDAAMKRLAANLDDLEAVLSAIRNRRLVQ